MSSTSLLSKGKDFSQSESLTRRLSGLVRDYPEGIGIFKELVQNADDAGAKRISFVLDWRSHPTSRLNHPTLATLLGPSMLVFNDAKFTSEDFEGLKSLGEGGKRKSLRKTGRFGLGFNSVYNMTDYPNFVSGESICFFDPHGSAVPYTDATSKGKQWNLSEFSQVEPSFIDAFQTEQFNIDSDYFDGTLFRLPFRTKEQAKNSKICTTPFTRAGNANDLLRTVESFGEELLLFLKSIEEIEVREIEPDGSEQIKLLLKTWNPYVVRTQRRSFLQVLEKNQTPNGLMELCRTSPQKLPQTSYLHQIQTITPQTTANSTWRVVHMMNVDGESRLVDIMSALNNAQEKAVPWAGAAARVKTDSPSSVTGKQYCFLPLPKPTGLPIHIHGYFDLNSSRQGSTNSDNTGSAAVRSQWNDLLVKHVVVPACVLLIESLAEDVGKDDPIAFYDLWPINSSKLDAPLDGIAVQFIEAVQNSAVLCSNLLDSSQEKRWVKPKQLSILPNQAIAHNVFAPLTADDLCLPEPALPKRLIEAFSAAQHPLRELTPKHLRAYLQQIEIPQSVPIAKAPKPSLRNWQWVRSLLEYCLSDNHADLTALPLAILANGHLQCFGDSELGNLYLADSLQRKIFVEQPQWFLDEALQLALPKLSQGVEGISPLTPEGVVEQLKSLTIWEEELPQQWLPDGEELPNAPWIALIYQYFTKSDSLPLQFPELPIVPGCDGNLYAGGETNTPLWTKARVNTDLQSALDYFDVSLVSTEDVDRSVFSRFLGKHPISEPDSDIEGNGLIFALTGCDLIDTLYGWREDLPAYESEYYESLLTYLRTEAFKLTDSAKRKLSATPIFPTRCGTATSLDAPNVYLPEAELPNVPLNLTLLKVEESWRHLLQVTLSFTEVKKLSLERLIIDCILPNYPEWDLDEQLIALAWIRLNLPLAVEASKRVGKDYQALQQAVGRTPLVHCTDGQIRAAQSIYRPGEKRVTDVLGACIALPDMANAYADGSDLWMSFFDDLGIMRRPSPQDLIDHTNSLQKRCAVEGMDCVAADCMKLLFYIEAYWEPLSSERVRVGEAIVAFPTALKDKAWLPVEQDAKELERWPGASALPQKSRLYRPGEILFAQEVNLAASQRHYLKLPSLLRAEVTTALGFKRPSLSEVVKHFGYLLERGKEDKLLARSRKFSAAIERVYGYLENAFTKGGVDEVEKRKFRQRYSKTECLWDGKSRFWRPEHVFEGRVSFFGHRRLGLENGKFLSLYRLLGQKRYPQFQDYLDFIAEVQREYDDRPISNPAEVIFVVAVLQRMASVLEKVPDPSLQPDFLLTEDLFLLPAKTIIIPDAPWYEGPVREEGIAKLLHPDVSRTLGDRAGSPSLLRNISARPVSGGLSLHTSPIAKDQAMVWQTHMQSLPFHQGLERLLVDSNLKASNVNWKSFSLIQVVATDKVLKNLYWGNRIIANGVLGDAYYDEKENIYYIRYDESVGINYLADSLNQQLATDKCALADKSKLIRLIEAEPNDVSCLLDSLRVRSFQSLILPDLEEPILPVEEASTLLEPVSKDDLINIHKPTHLVCSGKSFALNKEQDDVRIVSPIDRTLSTKEQPTTSSQSDKGTKKRPEILTVRRPKQNAEVCNSGSSKGRPNQRNDRWKTVAYPIHDLHPDRDAEQLTHDARANVESKGIRHVLEYERQRGRKPEEMPTNYPGYDIESVNLDGSIRYVEVKSFRWYWSASGAKLSHTQFEMAQKKGNDYWLYVVEIAEDDKKFKIHRIQNPANRVKDFYFDDGWKKISATDNEYADLLQL